MPLLRSSSLVLVLFGVLTAHTAYALPGDKEQAIHISADQAVRDEKQGLTTYSGNVVFIQGSMHISADKVTVFQSQEGRGKIVAVGQPARMRQKPEVDKEMVHARANTIEYFEDEDRVRLQSNARIQQGGSTVTGNTIDYYIAEQLVKADSDRAVENSRVQVVLPPSTLKKSEKKDAVPEGE